MAYRFVRPALFRLDPEKAHELALNRLETLNRSPRLLDIVTRHFLVLEPRLRTKVWNLSFASPIGLAAGFDKNARVPSALAALGFGSVEIGTVTALAQEGNPTPRIFRIPESRAVINRLGFNNDGKDAVAARLARLGRPPVPLGINIGKSRITPAEAAIDDYVASFEALEAYADYVVVNVSSPNTPGLRDLQAGERLAPLLATLKQRARELAKTRGSDPVPIVVKVSPDMDEAGLRDVAETARAERADGIIAVNTTLARKGVEGTIAAQAGGLSGAPLRERADEVMRTLHRLLGRAMPLVGVGGIFTGDDAYARIRAGASLVQVYTGFVYGGWSTAHDIAKRLAALLERDGLANVADAVGLDAQ
ncbi:MAG: quinone-dependent dihydroorotate dehydrogenase [Thermoplasmatota archaeon]